MLFYFLIIRPVLLLWDPGETILEKFRLAILILVCVFPQLGPHQMIVFGLLKASPSQVHYVPPIQVYRSAASVLGSSIAVREESFIFILEIYWPKQNNERKDILNTVSCLSFLPHVSSHSLASGRLRCTLSLDKGFEEQNHFLAAHGVFSKQQSLVLSLWPYVAPH